MDDDQRGALFVEREKIEHRIEVLRSELMKIGKTLTELGRVLQGGSPERAVFPNAPDGLGVNSHVGYANTPSFEWRQLGRDLDPIPLATAVQEMDQRKQRLKALNSQLGDRPHSA